MSGGTAQYPDTSGGGSSTPAAGSITLAMLADLATDKVIGRSTAGTGVPEAVACTATGRAVIACASASAVRTALGLVIGTDVVAPRSDDYQLVGTVAGQSANKDITIDSDTYDYHIIGTLKDAGTGGVYIYGRANGAATSLRKDSVKWNNSTINGEYRTDWNDWGGTGASNGAYIRFTIDVFGAKTYAPVYVICEASSWTAAHVTVGTRRNNGLYTAGALTSIGWSEAQSTVPTWEYTMWRKKRA